MTKYIPLESVDASVMGLPRPLATAPDGKLRPVPQTQKDGEWGDTDPNRMRVAKKHGHCLVCGEFVERGKIFLLSPHRHPTLEVATLVQIQTAGSGITAADNGPLHDKCALLTRAHCMRIRALIKDGTIKELDYVHTHHQ